MERQDKRSLGDDDLIELMGLVLENAALTVRGGGERARLGQEVGPWGGGGGGACVQWIREEGVEQEACFGKLRSGMGTSHRTLERQDKRSLGDDDLIKLMGLVLENAVLTVRGGGGGNSGKLAVGGLLGRGGGGAQVRIEVMGRWRAG